MANTMKVEWWDPKRMEGMATINDVRCPILTDYPPDGARLKTAVQVYHAQNPSGRFSITGRSLTSTKSLVQAVERYPHRLMRFEEAR